jgi:hypothetical protein
MANSFEDEWNSENPKPAIKFSVDAELMSGTVKVDVKNEKEVANYWFNRGVECSNDLKAENSRAKILLKAAYDLLQKQQESHFVLNLLEKTVHYDEADCDGYCLQEDISSFLEYKV